MATVNSNDVAINCAISRALRFVARKAVRKRKIVKEVYSKISNRE
jgi:hypothetical protein